MSVIGLAKNSTVTSQPAVRLPSDFGDIVGMTYDQTRLNFNSDSSRMAEIDARKEQAKRFKEAMGTEASALRDTDSYKARTVSPYNRYMDRDLDMEIERLKQNPELAMILKNVPTGKEIEGLAKGLAKLTDEQLREAEYFANTDWVGTAGFVGGGGSGVTDPVNLLTIPFGAGMGSTALRTVATEMAISVAADVAIQPSVMAWQEQLGKQYGMSEAMTSTLATALLSGGLSGVIAGATRKSRARYAEQMRVRDDLESALEVRSDPEAERFQLNAQVLSSFEPPQLASPTNTWHRISDPQGETDFVNLTLMGANDALPLGLRQEIRAAANEVHNRSMNPVDQPTTFDLTRHKSNIDASYRAMEDGSFTAMNLQNIAWTKFAEIDTHAHIDMMQSIGDVVGNFSDTKALNKAISERLMQHEGLHSELAELRSSVLTRSERLDTEQRIYELEDEVHKLPSEESLIEDLEFTTGSKGRTGSKFSQEQLGLKRGQDISLTTLRQKRDTLENLKARLEKNKSDIKRRDDLIKFTEGRGIPESMASMVKSIRDSVKSLRREADVKAATSINPQHQASLEAQAIDLLPPPTRTADEVDAEIVSRDRPIVKEQEQADFDALPDSFQLFDEHGNLVTVRQLRDDMVEADRVAQETASCAVGGVA